MNFFKINGFFAIYNEGDINKNDGVIVYIKNIYKSCYSIEHTIIGEIKVLNIIIRKLGQKILINALYRSPATCPNTLVHNLHSFFEKFINQNSNFHFFVGDINIDIKSNKECAQNYLNILSELGFKSLINKPTRIKNESKSCIDHIFLKSCESVNIKSFIINTDLTDHFPVAALVECEKLKQGNQEYMTKQFKKD